MRSNIVPALRAILFSSLVSAQLSGGVGPSTTTASKAATKVCNILNYGGVASKTTDNGPAIASAWAACQSGGEGKSFSSLEASFLSSNKMQFISPLGIMV